MDKGFLLKKSKYINIKENYFWKMKANQGCLFLYSKIYNNLL